jgi:hypothetical protein
VYKFVAQASGTMTFDMAATAGGIDSFLEIVDANGKTIGSNNDVARGTLNSQVKLAVTAGKSYFVLAESYKQTKGAYNLTWTSDLTDDFRNINGDAQSLEMNSNADSVTGTINYSGDVDVFKVLPGISGKLTLTLAPTGDKSLASTLVLGDGVTDSLASGQAGAGVSVTATYTVTSGQAYYIRVGGAPGSHGAYQLQVTVERIPPSEPTIPVVTSAAATITAITTQFGTGWQLLVVGTNGDDAITISQTGSTITLTTPSGASTFNGSFTSVVIYGFDGDDTIRTTSTVTSSVWINGGNGDDSIYNAATGLGTILTGNGGNLVVSVGAGMAAITGGSGLDSFWVDAADALSGVSAASTSANAVHLISAFYQPFSNNFTNANYVPLTVAGQSLADPAIDGYAAGYSNFGGSPLFVNDPKYNDIKQGSCGDCYFLAALGSLAQNETQAIQQAIAPLGDGTYVVRFYRNGVATYVRVDADLPVNGSSLSYAHAGAQGQIWASLMEKAYAFFRTGANSYASLWGGWMGDVYRDVVNSGSAFAAISPGSSSSALVSTFQTALSTGHGVTVASNSSNTGPIYGNHAYMVQSVTSTTITVYNPWGVDGASYDSNYGDGLLTLSINQFKAAFCYMSICSL